MTRFLKLMALGALAITGLLAIYGPSGASAAAFMKLGDIKGEATDQEHKDWIIIESMSSPIFRSGQSSGQTSGMASGKRQHKPLVITKAMDKASPKLLEAATQGKVFSKVIIHVQANEGSSAYGGSRATYLKYELTNVMITSYNVDRPSAAGDVPMEEFSLNYEEIKLLGSENQDEKEDKPGRNER